jgi:hypothetical protein
MNHKRLTTLFCASSKSIFNLSWVLAVRGDFGRKPFSQKSRLRFLAKIPVPLLLQKARTHRKRLCKIYISLSQCALIKGALGAPGGGGALSSGVPLRGRVGATIWWSHSAKWWRERERAREGHRRALMCILSRRFIEWQFYYMHTHTHTGSIILPNHPLAPW